VLLALRFVLLLALRRALLLVRRGGPQVPCSGLGP
jgi:hypothetical protein